MAIFPTDNILMQACPFSSCFRPWFSRFLFVFLMGICSVTIPVNLYAQDKVIVLTEDRLNQFQIILLTELEGWKYTNSFDGDWLDTDYDDEHWETINFKDFSPLERNESKIEAWFRIKITIDSSLSQQHLSLIAGTLSALELYLNGELIRQYGIPHPDPKIFKSHDPTFKLGDPVHLKVGEVYTIGIYFVDHYSYLIAKYTNRQINPTPRIFIKTHHHNEVLLKNDSMSIVYFWLGPLLLLSGLFWLMYFQNKDEKTVFLVAVFTTSLSILCWSLNIGTQSSTGVLTTFTFRFLAVASSTVAVAIIPMIIDKLLTNKISKGYRYLFWFLFVTNCLGFLFLKSNEWLQLAYVVLVIATSIHLSIKRRVYIKTLQWVMLSGMLLTVFCIVIFLIINIYFIGAFFHNIVVTGIYLSMPISMLIYFTIRFKNNLNAARSNAARVTQLSSEKEKLIEAQKSELEQQVKSRTEELEQSLESLKSTQAQLVQQEKLASLGQLTAGIAHEIKNPLNFVNNFSEVSIELIEEALEEIEQIEKNDHTDEATAILSDIKANLLKIHEHGSRADSIVRSMLEHSRGGNGQMEPTDIKALMKEYVNLAFHGMRAGKHPINLDVKLDIDETVGNVPLISEDFSRVVINLCNNAFDAMRSKVNDDSKTDPGYLPTLNVRIQQQNQGINITFEDNGPGIPEEILDNILQPFFTTKKGTEGTGLGLSITNDIVKAHGGKLTVYNRSDQSGAAFNIFLPYSNK